MKAPTINLDGTGIVALAALGVLGVLGVWLYSKKDAITKTIGDAAETALASVNPADDRNLVYGAVNGIGGALTGNENFTLGGAIYDVTHDGSLDPRNDNNVIYRSVSSVGESVTGQKGWTLGGAIYDLFNPAPPLNPQAAPGVYGTKAP